MIKVGDLVTHRPSDTKGGVGIVIDVDSLYGRYRVKWLVKPISIPSDDTWSARHQLKLMESK